MNGRMMSLSVSYCAVALLFGSSAHAEPTPACFQSKEDYDTYVRYESPNATGEVTTIISRTPSGVKQYHRSYPGAPAKWKDIVINHTFTYKDGILTIDASTSTTPTGEIQYAWENDPTNFRSTDSKISTAMNAPGQASIEVSVKDPVCGRTEKKRLIANVK